MEHARISYGHGFHPDCPSRLAVSAGDTVYTLSRRCGVSVRALIAANHLEPPYFLVVGRRLIIPGGGRYVVRSGDTLLGLAYRFHLPFRRLAAYNHKRPPYRIFVGERLRIPTSGGGRHRPAVRLAESAPRPVPYPSSQRPPARAPASARRHAVAPRAEFAPAMSRPIATARRQGEPAASALAHPVFRWPVRGRIIDSFGPQGERGRNNDGINIAADEGTPVDAAGNGTVVYVGNQLRGFGNLILIKHADGWMTAYAHTARVLVHRGEVVRRGQEIATVGRTGAVRHPQLHFEIRHGVEAVNPIDFLPRSPIS
jgi:murein DD-endopeptidase MepM/ murein hydrolase activator NlpD